MTARTDNSNYNDISSGNDNSNCNSNCNDNGNNNNSRFLHCAAHKKT
jgi:hypothetical protein